MGLNFEAVWQQAVDHRRAADIARRTEREERARRGEKGAFAQAFQLELDAIHDDLLRTMRRQTWGIT